MIKALLGGGMYLLFVVGVIIKWQSKRRADAAKDGNPKGTPASIASSQIDDPIQTLGDSHWQVRLEAVKQLLDHPTPDAIPALVAALGDTDPDVRQTASDTLVKLGHEVIPQVSEVLENGSLDARIMAVQTLATIGTPETIDDLSYALLHDESIWIRLPAVEALTQQSQPSVKATLIQALGDHNREVYNAVARALRAFGTDDALQAIDDHPFQPSAKDGSNKLEERY